jgi:hypothetical protein
MALAWLLFFILLSQQKLFQRREIDSKEDEGNLIYIYIVVCFGWGLRIFIDVCHYFFVDVDDDGVTTTTTTTRNYGVSFMHQSTINTNT